MAQLALRVPDSNHEERSEDKMGIVPGGMEIGERDAQLLEEPLQAVPVGQLERMLGGLDRVDVANRMKVDT